MPLPTGTSRVLLTRLALAVAAAVAALAATAALVTREATSAASPDPSVVGAWSAPLDLRVSGIHSTVLPNGKVLLFSYPVAAVGSDAFVWDPSTGSSTNVSLNWARDIFCSGHTLLPDGRLLITGGHVHAAAFGLGVANTDVFDPATNTFTAGPLLSQARWYPTSIELGDGRILTFGGWIDKTTAATTVDSYDPATNAMTQLPATANRQTNNYPRLHLLASGKISFTNQARSYLFNPATNSWANSALSPAPGRGESDSSILLPGLSKVLEFGGSNGSGGATATAQIIDFANAAPSWRPVASMHYARVWTNGVLLPDGTVLAVGGGGGGTYANPVTAAELFDPATEQWSLMASQAAPRVYHSTAVLLPDGRVLSAGHDNGTMQTTGEIYSPPYLFRGARPTIDGAPANVTYGQSFTVSSPNAGSITRLTLVRPSSVTHSINTDQRLLDLPFTTTSTTGLSVVAPASGTLAPPGWYMLFAFNASGVPSVASWVRVARVTPAQPSISSFSPSGGSAGTAVTITGANLEGATSVTFNGTPAASFTNDSGSEVTATVPAGATTGQIAVTTPAGSATSSVSFTVTQPPAYADSVLADGAVGYWRLGDSAGSAAVDASAAAGNGSYLGGVLHNAPGALARDANAAASFDGTSGYVAVPNAASLNVGDVFTYELWVRRSATMGVTQRLLHKGGGTATLGFGANNKVVLLPGGTGASTIVTSNIAITDQNWHHVVATKNGSAAHIYIDGVDRTTPGTNTTVTNNATPLNIARATSASAYFSGALDEVAIYPTALTAAQVQQHYRSATG